MGTSKKHERQSLKKMGKFKPLILSFLPILVILIVWLVFSHPYFLKGLVPFSSTYLVSFFNPWTNYYGMPVKNGAMPDVITQLYPWKKITIDALKNGVIPSWNPYQFSGNPHLANVQSAVFTPFNLLFFVLPFIDAWSMLILLQPLCAGLFMYLFLRSLRLNVFSLTLGSISFMFCSFIVTWMAYGTLGYALLFLPLFLYGIERFVSKNDWVAILLLIVSPPLTIFSGHFQTSLYVLIVSFCYLLARCIREKKIKKLSLATIYIGIGIIISSLQIIPTYRFYSQSVRSESYIQDEAIPASQLVRIIAPDFYGNPVTRNDWVGHYAEWGIYAGIIPFLLAIFALLKNRKKFAVYFFGIVAIVSLLFSFQPQFISFLAFSKIPVLSTSTPSRIAGIISFCIAVLAAFGLDSIIEDWKQKKVSKQLVLMVLIGILVLGVTWLIIPTLGGEGSSIAKRNFVLPTGLFLLTSIVLFSGFIRYKDLKVILPILLILLTSFEMIRFSGKWMPFDPKELVYPEVPSLKYLQENAHENRVYGLIGNEVFGMFGLYGIEGYDPLYSKRYGEFISATGDGKTHSIGRSAVVFPRTGAYAKQILDILGVKYIYHSKGDGRGSWVFPFWDYSKDITQVFADEQYEVYENKTAFPRSFIVNSYKINTDGQQTLDEMLTGKTDIRQTVILEEKPTNAAELNTCQTQDTFSHVTIEKYYPSHIQLKANSKCNGLVVLSDVYYPGWVAYVDGIKTPIYRANYVFRAISVPDGEHTVILKYENWYL